MYERELVPGRIHSKKFFQCWSVRKSVSFHSYNPPVNTSDSQQMNGVKMSLESWEWRSQCQRSMVPDWLTNQSIKSLGRSGKERERLFRLALWPGPAGSVSVRVSPDSMLYLLHIQTLHCRILFNSRHNPYTPTRAAISTRHGWFRSMLLPSGFTSKLFKYAHFSRRVYFIRVLKLKGNNNRRPLTAAALSSFYFHWYSSHGRALFCMP